MILIGLLVTALGLTYESQSGLLTWPESSWVLFPVQSSSWHAGQSVSISITFNPSTSLSSGIVQMQFPSTFINTTVNVPITTAIVSGTDFQVSFTNFILPSQGTYGPIAIYTRNSVTGTIFDSNTNFCTLSIASSMPTASPSSLAATFYDITKVYVGVSSSIYFDFAITQNLWKYDTFYLYLDSHFSMSSSPICKSLKVIGQFNELNSTNPESLNTLACNYDSANNRVVVYGLGVDVIITQIGSITGRILISGFTNPNAAYTSSAFSWRLYISRFATNVFIAAYTGNGPSLQPGTVTINSWLPNSGFNVSNIVQGYYTYMNLSITLPHTVPTSGQIVFTFSGGINIMLKAWKSDNSQVDVLGTQNYLLVTPAIGGTYSITEATTLICSGFTSPVLPGTYVFTTYTYFISTSPAVASIYTYADSGTTVIDQATANPATITYASDSDVAMASAFNLYFSTSLNPITTYVANTGPSNAYIVAHVQMPVNTSATAYSINLPISTSVYETTLKVPSIAAKYLVSTSSISTSMASSTTLGVTLTGQTITYSATANYNQYFSAVLYNGAGSPGSINFPNVASNLYTRYEALFQSTFGGIMYVYARAITIIPDNPVVTFQVMCIDSGVAGLPGQISFTPRFSYSVISGATLYLEIDIIETGVNGNIANDFDSGLQVGQLFPFTSTFTGNLYSDFSNSPSLLWTNFSSVTGSSQVSIAFPMGKLINLNVYSASISLYYVNSSRTDIENVVMSSTSVTFTSIANTNGNWAAQSITDATTTYSTNTLLPSLTLGLTPGSAYSSPSAGYIGLLLPKGFQINNSPSVVKSSSLSNVFGFTSANMYYKTPGIFAALGSSDMATSGVSSFVFHGVVTSEFFYTAANTVSVQPVFSGSWGSNCYSVSGTHPTLTLQPSSISTPTYSITSVNGGGPNSYSSNFTVTFANINQIPSGGNLRFSFSSGWVITSNTNLNLMINNINDTSNTTILLGSPCIISNLPTVAAGSTIALIVSNLAPPSNTGASASLSGILSSISTYATSDTSQGIDSWTDSSNNAVLVSTSGTSGNITVVYSEIYPNSTSTSAHFKVIFYAAHYLPSGSVFNIGSPVNNWKSNGDVSASCYFTLQFSSCSVSSYLTITTAQAYVAGQVLTLIVENAFPVTSSGLTSGKLYIYSTYAGYLIDSNSLTQSALNVSAQVASASVTLSIFPLTSAEYANYTFTVYNNISAGATLSIVFPAGFDNYLGNAYEKYKITNPGAFYIDCYSSLDYFDCEVSHKIVTIYVSDQITTNTTFILSGIINPAYAATLSPIRFYVFNTSGLYLANENIQISGISTIPTSTISLKSVSVDNNYLEQLADYTFGFILPFSTQINDQIVVSMPEMFDLNRDSGLYLTCDLYSVNVYYNLNNFNYINTTNTCVNIGNNELSLSLVQSMAWNTSLIAYLQVFGMRNPEWGLKMSPLMDTTVYTQYDFYTSLFNIKVLRSSAVIASSFGNMNTAYSGLSNNQFTFTVNGYSAGSSIGIIKVIPGTQTTDLYVTSSAFQSKVAQIQPNNYNNIVSLGFTSASNFEIYNGQTSFAFRVSAPIYARPSLNFINWTIVEVPLDGSSTKYIQPINTPVEVYNGTVPISIGNINPVSIGTSSPPISVSMTNSPESSLNVLISTSASGIQITPSTLQFTPGINLLYFSVGVTASYPGSPGDRLILNYTLTGNDESAFTIPSFSFLYVSNSSATTAKILSINPSKLGRTTLKVNVVTDNPTVICWALSHQNTVFPTYSSLVNSTASLIGNNGQLSFNQQITAYLATVPKTPTGDQSWASFQKQYYTAFIQKVWTGCTYTGSSSVDIFDIDWLWANSTYKVLVYAGTSNITNSSSIVTTSMFGDAINISISVSQKIDQSYLPTVQDSLAGGLGIYSAEFVQGSTSLTDSQSYIVNTLCMNRQSQYAPIDTYSAVSGSSLQSSVSTVLNTIGVIQTPYISQNDVSRSAYPTPYLWNLTGNAPGAFAINIVTNSSVSGQICCVALTPGNFSLTYEQIFLGLAYNNTKAPSNCVTNNAATSANYTVTVSGLKISTLYTVTCAAFDSYPVWPSPGNMRAINVTTSNSNGNSTTVSFAQIIYVALIGLFFI